MARGVVFLVCIPTSNHEHELIFGVQSPNRGKSAAIHRPKHQTCNSVSHQKLDLDLRPKKSARDPLGIDKSRVDGINDADRISPDFVSMETVLDELLKRLKVEHVVWCKDKANLYYEVIFPIPSGDPCENCLHSLTELGIGVKMNSIVSVIPTQCTYNGMGNILTTKEATKKYFDDKNAWEAFVDSIRSKLTVQQVVDGVQSGGDLTFDYILLVLTADCLAGLGLVENSATNVVAAMLVSPLMGPVMSLTFGTIIADRNLQSIGFKSLLLGIFMSIAYGFVFGLLLGTTEMPWGYGDWPTDEMKSRGNYRSLWMGVLWALPSGTGVAVALLQGSNGPLIGVAISASLLPPVVNCGLFWALGCIWLIYKPVKIPHIKGESYTDLNSSYSYVYTEYLPLEFFCNGIISACLTFVNVICIFITAIIVLKIKEVAAPYTSTPELRRFWEHDIRRVRGENNSRDTNNYSSLNSSYYDGYSPSKQRSLEHALNEAVQEAMDDKTFRKVQRISYGQFAPEEVSQRLGGYNGAGVSGVPQSSGSGLPNNSGSMTEDLAALDKLITLLLGQSNTVGNKRGSRSDSWRNSQSSNRVRMSLRGYHPLQTPGNINPPINTTRM
ncbi:uncharacterized protein LOC105692775 [Athalia rosae]|uniref:uncharacterized protein LOC105692775 n=1 Tax=Athalia rosae TaxID=37344 RepID=UPI00203353E7|nr:uncharacterized protein LOC105692775 [Athalia rosae]